MKVTISQSALSKSVSQVAKCVSKNATLPILSGILLSATSGVLSLRSSDMDTSIRTSSPANVEEEGDTVVSGKVLESIVRSLPDSAVSISTNGNTALVTCGRTSYRLNTLDPKDFPSFPEAAPDEVVELPVSTLSEMASSVARCVSKDQARPVLGCVQVAVDGDLLRLVATDSYRLMVCDTNLTSEGSFVATVPGTALRDALRMANPAGTVELGTAMNQITIRFGATEYVTRKVDGRFPDYKQLLPKSYNVSARVDVSIMASALKHVAVMAKENPTVRITLADNCMTLATTSTLDGESYEAIDVESDGDLTFAVNSHFLSDGIECADEEVFMELVDAVNPVVMKSYGAVNYLYLLMPTRA